MSDPAGGGSEADLLAAARAGDGQALEALLERHEARLYRFARRLCRHREDAEDVLQESLLAAARGLGGFRGASSIGTWLYTIARSFCIKKRRKSVFAPTEVSLDTEASVAARGVADPARRPDEALEASRLETALERAIGALDRPYREVLLLRDVEGLPAADVARVTGLSVAAVKTRLHRARGRVRDALAPLMAPRGEAGPAAPNRTCPDVVRLFSRYLEGDISAQTCASMEKHLASCPRCAAACEGLKEVLRLCRTAPDPVLPAEVQDRLRRAVHEIASGRLSHGAPSKR
ncbi:MAG TPA: sigma-70 family RNA polymerase sigma factor [Vicinamibacteria bacterium]|nr:sigma-70 family RNA polymerase sigma factor [Vicinamibacteria bacterium]